MNMIRYSPWNIGDRDAVRFFPRDSLFSVAKDASGVEDWVPAIDIKEDEDRYLIRADVPGVEPDDLDITLDKGVLTLQGQRDTRNEEEKDGLRRVERVSGKFYRRFNLPETADADAVSADYEQGVLEISIPKQAEAQPQRIQVKTN